MLTVVLGRLMPLALRRTPAAVQLQLRVSAFLSTPASKRRTSVSTSEVAGPRVATILVRIIRGRHAGATVRKLRAEVGKVKGSGETRARAGGASEAKDYGTGEQAVSQARTAVDS